MGEWIARRGKKTEPKTGDQACLVLLLSIIGFLTLALSHVCSAAATARTDQIMESVLPFAGEDSVRIGIALRARPVPGPVEMVGVITPFPAGKVLWQGPLGHWNGSGSTVLNTSVIGLKPRPWSPVSPSLYQLTVRASTGGRIVESRVVRFGFRSFVSHGGHFVLNGRPIFLRGIAINPPGRGIPPPVGESRAFATAYVRYLKSQNVNILRLEHDSQTWFDVCDELGMMIYQGDYGAPYGGDKNTPPADLDTSLAEYKSVFSGYIRHPSIVIDVLSNELPYTGKRGAAFQEFLGKVYQRLREWDPGRLYIGNAGYGEGRVGDVRDMHRYWGWYYNTFLTYYNLRDRKLFGDPAKTQPWTFTECVGCFTGPTGEFNLVERKQLGPQLNWTGHSGSQAHDALEYQAFMIQQAVESFRRLRETNPYLSGIMPFTILFYNWSGISSFQQMKPKPAMEQLEVSYQPVLLSWELWTPQVYAGHRVRAVAHLVNDSDEGSDLNGAWLVYQVRNASGKAVLRGKTRLPPTGYFGTSRQVILLDLPRSLETGDYVLSGQVVNGNQVISHNQVKLFIAGNKWNKPRRVPGEPIPLYDPPGKTALALKRLGIPVRMVGDMAKLQPGIRALLIGEEAWGPSLTAAGAQLQQFVNGGGRLLCLGQDSSRFNTSWLPVEILPLTASANAPIYPVRTRPSGGNMNINLERPWHPVFEGLSRERLALWSDYTGWDETRPGFPEVYPVTHGFKLTRVEDLAKTAVLANYDRGLEGVGLCEVFVGKGSVILSGFDLVNRAGLDPAADRLLENLAAYTGSKESHSVYPLVEAPVRWGNYPTERGLISGPLHGLTVNPAWTPPPTAPFATPRAEGSWNMRPGEGFVAHGRRPFGPFGYTSGGGVRDLNPASRTGSGIFWLRVPEGKKTIITRVQNPAQESGSLEIQVNGAVVGSAAIPGGQTALLRSALPPGITEFSVRYTGSKTLVILETAFE